MKEGKHAGFPPQQHPSAMAVDRVVVGDTRHRQRLMVLVFRGVPPVSPTVFLCLDTCLVRVYLGI